MAVFSSGNFSYGSGGTARIELHVDDPPAVAYPTSQVSVGVRLYVITNGSLTDSSNSNQIAYNGIVFVSNGASVSHAGFPTGGSSLVASGTFTVNLVFGSTQTFTMSGSISGYDVLGNRSVSGNVTFPARPATIPGQMGQPGVDTITSNSVRVHLNTNPDNGGSAIIDYLVRRSQTNPPNTPGTYTDVGTTSSPITLTGLQRATTYYLTTYARNAVGYSVLAPTRTFTTLALTPGQTTLNVPTSPSQSGFSITWTAPADDGGSAITNYTLQVAEDAAFTVGLQQFTETGTSKTFTTLSPGKTYHVRIRANNAVGASATWSVTRSIATLTGFSYGVAGAWVDIIIYYGVDGVWVPITPRYGVGGTWVPS